MEGKKEIIPAIVGRNVNFIGLYLATDFVQVYKTPRQLNNKVD
jgi:hypothetical protein